MNNLPSSLPQSYWPNKKEGGAFKNVQNGPPPVPSRQYQQISRFSYGNGLIPLSRIASSPYSTTFNRFRTPYNHFYSPYEENSFRQLVDESTRPAFQSIETIVEVFTSISTMLESTYHAVHNSYSAILGVVDNFSRLKDNLTQIVSLLAFLRGLQWLCLKILYLLGLKKEDSAEKIWETAKKAFESPSSSLDDEKNSAWPIFWFIALAFGAPWLMYKLFSKGIHKKITDPTTWANENGAYFIAVAKYDFTAENSQELSFRTGQKLIVAPKDLQTKAKGWLLASNNGKKVGLIPSNYVQIWKFPKVVRFGKPPNSSSLETDNISNMSQLDAAFIEASSTVQLENKNGDLQAN